MRVSNAGLNNVFTDTIPRIQQNSWSRCFLPCILSGKKFQRCKFAVNTHRTYRTSYYSSGEHSGTKKHTRRTGGATCKHFCMEIFSSLQSRHTVIPLTKERHHDVVASTVASHASCFSMVFVNWSLVFLQIRCETDVCPTHIINYQKQHLEVLLVIYSRDLGIHWFLENLKHLLWMPSIW